MQYMPFLAERGEHMSILLVISMNGWRAGEDSGSKGSTRCTACTSASFPTMSYRNSKQVLYECSGLERENEEQ